MGGGDGQAGAGGQDHGAGGTQLGGEAAAGGQLGDVLAHRGHYPGAENGETEDDAHGADQQNPAGHGGFATDHAFVDDDAVDGSQRPDGVGHIIGAMSEGHGTGGEDHQHGKDALYGVKAEFLVGFRVGLDTAENHGADQRDDQAAHGSPAQAGSEADFQADMLEPLEQGHGSDREAHQEHVEGHHALGPLEGIVLVEHQFLYALDQRKGNKAGQ